MLVSGFAFGLVAVLHALRTLYQRPVNGNRCESNTTASPDTRGSPCTRIGLSMLLWYWRR